MGNGAVFSTNHQHPDSLPADMFPSSYESGFIQKLVKDKILDKHLFGIYVDDILSIVQTVANLIPLIYLQRT